MPKIKLILQQKNMLSLISEPINKRNWKIITKIINQKRTMIIGLDRFNDFLSLINHLYTSIDPSFAIDKNNEDSYDIFYYLLVNDFFFPALEKLAELKDVNINPNPLHITHSTQTPALADLQTVQHAQPLGEISLFRSPDLPSDFCHALPMNEDVTTFLAGLDGTPDIDFSETNLLQGLEMPSFFGFE